MNEVFEKILKRLEENAFEVHTREYGNVEVVGIDAINDVIEQVAEEFATDTNVGTNGWIMCDVKMPEERDSIFAQFKGTDKWKNSMFERMSEFVNATVEFEDGTRMVKTLHTVDGKWHMGSGFLKYKVIAWQPLPSPIPRNRGEQS